MVPLDVEPVPPVDAIVEGVLASAGTTLGPHDVAYRTDGLTLAWISPSVTTVLGFPPEELVGHPARNLLTPDQDMSWVDENRMRLLAGQEVAQRMRMRRVDGEDVWVVGVARPLPEGGQGFVATFRMEETVQVLSRIGGAEPGTLLVAGVETRHEILGYLDDLMVRGDSELCVLVVEFANLRKVNDSLGFEVGEAALTELARRIRATMPAADRVGRISGKEFLIGCRRPPTRSEAQERASQLLQAWSEPIIMDGTRIEPMLAGAVVPASENSTALGLLREADIALSHTHADGNAAVVVFEEEMGARALRRFVLEDELRYALGADEFELHFQPIVHLETGAPVATEALIRWRHPREGLLAPPNFIPVAEESRLIRPLGRFILAQALEALSALPPHALQVGINVSTVELSDPSWLDSITFTVEQSGVDPCCLVLEITETAVLNADRDIGSDLKRLRAMGVGIFLDDFGTGYSSLALLRDLPVSGIKLDKSFTATLDDPESFGAALARGIMDMVRPLGLTGVAEGIEDARQIERLTELGWEYGQGFAFGRPGPFSSLPPLPARMPGEYVH